MIARQSWVGLTEAADWTCTSARETSCSSGSRVLPGSTAPGLICWLVGTGTWPWGGLITSEGCGSCPGGSQPSKT